MLLAQIISSGVAAPPPFCYLAVMGDAEGAMEVGDSHEEEDDGTLIAKCDMALVPLSGRLFLDKGFDDSYVLADTQTLQQHVFHKHDHEGIGLELMFSDCGMEVCINNAGLDAGINNVVCTNASHVVIVFVCMQATVLGLAAEPHYMLVSPLCTTSCRDDTSGKRFIGTEDAVISKSELMTIHHMQQFSFGSCDQSSEFSCSILQQPRDANQRCFWPLPQVYTIFGMEMCGGCSSRWIWKRIKQWDTWISQFVAGSSVIYSRSANCGQGMLALPVHDRMLPTISFLFCVMLRL